MPINKEHNLIFNTIISFIESNWRIFVFFMKTQGFAEHEILYFFDKFKQTIIK